MTLNLLNVIKFIDLSLLISRKHIIGDYMNLLLNLSLHCIDIERNGP